jgi:hypothetical protein
MATALAAAARQSLFSGTTGEIGNHCCQQLRQHTNKTASLLLTPAAHISLPAGVGTMPTSAALTPKACDWLLALTASALICGCLFA